MKTLNPLEYSIAYQWPRRLVQPDNWVEHIPFAFFLTEITQPKMLVELGTHSGNSYSAFCQAVLELALSTKCFAVDTWEGDEHAGEYGPEILLDFRKHHDPLYGHFSTLLKMRFDDAVAYFEDGSIDLLHIDGMHTFEAVKHDFETWQPKLSDQAVVVFHDTNVREREFGVWQFWRELTQVFPSWEFFHGNGLGIIGVGDDLKPEVKAFFDLQDEKNLIRDHFQSLGARLVFELRTRVLQEQLAEKTDTARKLNQELIQNQKKLENANLQNEEQRQTARKLNEELIKSHQQNKKLVVDKEKHEALLAEHKEKLQSLTAEHKTALQDLKQQVSEKEKLQSKLEEQTAEKEKLQSNLEEQTAEKEKLQSNLEEQSKLMQDLKKQASQCDELQSLLLDRKKTIQELKTQVEEHEQLQSTLAEQKKTLQEYELQLKTKNADLQKLNQQILENEQRIRSQNLRINQYEQEVLFYALSKSWRITRPLRKFMKFIKGKRNV